VKLHNQVLYSAANFIVFLDLHDLFDWMISSAA